MKYSNQHEAGFHFQRHQEFQSSNFYGRTYPNGTGEFTVSAGWGREAPPIGSTYVVFSYDTPIAWLDKDGGMHVVAQAFSPSTSQHQSSIRYRAEHASWATPQARQAADEANAVRKVEEREFRAQAAAQRREEYNARRRQQRADERFRIAIAAQLAAAEEQARQSCLTAMGAST